MSETRPAMATREEFLEAKLKIAFRALSQIEQEAWVPRKRSMGVIQKIQVIAHDAMTAIANLDGGR